MFDSGCFFLILFFLDVVSFSFTECSYYVYKKGEDEDDSYGQKEHTFYSSKSLMHLCTMH